MSSAQMKGTDPTDRIGPEEVPRPRSLFLVVHASPGSVVVPLQAGEELTLGRGADVSISISDPSLSRNHAKLLVHTNSVQVSDLGSTNGLYAGPRKVSTVELHPGEALRLGAVEVSLHGPGVDRSFARGVLGPESFRSILAYEVERCRHASRAFSIALVRSSNSGISPHIPSLMGRLRSIDRVSLHGPNATFVFLPELRAEEAMQSLQPFAFEMNLKGAIAEFPTSGTNIDALTEAVREASAVLSTPGITLTPSHGIPRLSEVRDEPLIASRLLARAFDEARRVAGSSLSVILRGESGVGKEIVARELHRTSPRASRPMVSLNCASIPPPLVESTLFGHERGSFTGALREVKGVFEAAHGGTVFLDEIGDLPLPAQAAMLRVLETKKVTRVGSTQEIPVDVRVIAATHQDIEASVAQGAFRRDLLYRLDGMTISIPPLRERQEEILALAHRFLMEASREASLNLTGFDSGVPEAFLRYAWPGNVRELRNVVFRAAMMARGDRVILDDLPERISGMSRPLPVHDSEPVPQVESTDLREALRRAETAIILHALKLEEWNQGQAALRLNIPPRTLSYKMKSLGIRRLGYAASE